MRLLAWILLVAGLGSACDWRPARREIYELPPGYHGYFHVQVDMPGCPPLDVRGGVTYFEIGPDGTACTSGAPPVAVFKARYFYRDKDHTELHWTTWGGGGMIWGGHGIGHLEKHGKRYLCPFGFFVGTEAEFKESSDRETVACSPREFDPSRTPGVIGPVD